MNFEIGIERYTPLEPSGLPFPQSPRPPCLSPPTAVSKRLELGETETWPGGELQSSAVSVPVPHIPVPQTLLHQYLVPNPPKCGQHSVYSSDSTRGSPEERTRGPKNCLLVTMSAHCYPGTEPSQSWFAETNVEGEPPKLRDLRFHHLCHIPFLTAPTHSIRVSLRKEPPV